MPKNISWCVNYKIRICAKHGTAVDWFKILVTGTVIASMDSYRKNFARTTSPIAQEKTTTAGKTKYQFNVAVNSYFQWVEGGVRKIEKNISGDRHC